MFCTNCGNQISDGAKFCENCGHAVENQTVLPQSGQYTAVKRLRREQPRGENRRISENIYLCPDGKYRWVYEYEMLKNPTILFTVWKVLAMSLAIVAILGIVLTGGDMLTVWDGKDLAIMGGVLAVLFVLSIIAYLIVAKSYGWKYMVLFEMDEEKIEHIIMAGQFEKARAMGWLTAMAGLVTGNPAMIGRGIDAAVRDRSVSDFARVKKVIGKRRRNTIFVNQTLYHNQVYVQDCDYDFVYDYIRTRCVNAKKIK